MTNHRLPTERAHGLQIAKMSEAFTELGVDVTVIHPRRRQADPKLRGQTVFDYYGLMESFAIKTLPYLDVYPLQKRLPRSVFTLLHTAVDIAWSAYAATLARRLKADLYLSREVLTAWWLTRLGLPVVFDAHRVPKGAQRLLLRQIAKYKGLVHVTTTTSWVRDRLITMGFDNNLVSVLPSAMDPTQFLRTPTKEICRDQLSLPADRPIVGYIGRFQALRLDKGIPTLIKAVAQIKAEGKLTPLLLCVGGPMDAVPSYIKLAQQEGLAANDFLFFDKVPNTEVPRWLKSCDVLTIPWGWSDFSAHETSPIKLFEYMAAGVPIVASDLPSLREILCHEHNAILVPPNDSAKLAVGIDRVLTDRFLSLHISSHSHSDVTSYTWHNRAASILAVSNRLL